MRKLFDSIENIDLNNHKYVDFFFKFVNIICLTIHLAIAAFSFVSGAKILGYFNIGSIVFYLFGFWLIKSKNYTLLFVLTEFEIIAHSYIVSLLFPVSLGFYLYLIPLVPLSFFCFYFARTKRIIEKGTLASLIAAIAYNYFYNLTDSEKAVYTDILTDEEADVIHVINSFLIFILLIIMCIIVITILYNYIGVISNENDLLNDEASHDPLTGLNNRRLLDIEMDKKLHLYDMNNTHFSILMCDIDDFKKVNDTYGHDEGDKVLIDVSNIIKECTRPGDFLCRWGGEEFLIILMNASTKEASLVAYRIKSAVEAHVFNLEEADIHCTITIGVAAAQKGMDKESMYELADSRMYKGKQTGKNKVVFE